MRTNIYLVRHAHSTYTSDELGRPLSTKGLADAERISNILKKEKIDRIISSPYKRAIQTVKGIANFIGKEIILEDGFKERTLSTKPLPEDFHTAIIDIYIQLYDYDENVRIHIIDHGVGMPTHMLENLFQQYYRGTTTDTASERTGLGMAIVYNLVRAHNGTISVESEPSKGTAFDISLPKTGRSQDNTS